MPPTNAPYGTWKSPLTTDVITEKTISIVQVIVDIVTGEIYHVEQRPHEGGRHVLVHSKTSQDVFGEPWSARTGAHEYGGSASAVYRDTALFTGWASKHVYTYSRKGGKWEDPTPISPDNPGHLFGEFHIHPTLPHLVVCILEDLTKPSSADVANSLVLLDANTRAFTTLASGADLNTFGRWHPDMPWEGSELHVASLDLTSTSLSPFRVRQIASPEHAQQNQLPNPPASGTTSPGLGKPLEQDFADPAWSLGTSNYAALKEDTILAPGTVNGQNGFLVIDTYGGQYSFLPSSYVSASQLRAIPSGPGAGASAVFVGTGDDSPAALVSVALLLGGARYEVLESTPNALDLPALKAFAFSRAEPKTFNVQSPAGSSQPLHVIFYAPVNKDYIGNQDEKPPCVINVHGGPTSSARPALKWLVQYWKSRGWAWVDVNYGGSSGYGRAYRERLEGKWGIVDVDDCVTAVGELGKAGLVDPKRVVTRGGSAGGFTTLAALVKTSGVYAAGTSSYGISDLQALEGETHKFESHSGHKLLGGSFAEIPEVYKELSPLTHAENISVPLLANLMPSFCLNQAEVIQKKVESHSGKVKSKLFPGEGHGWREAETIKEAILLEIGWYGDVLGIDVKP